MGTSSDSYTHYNIILAQRKPKHHQQEQQQQQQHDHDATYYLAYIAETDTYMHMFYFIRTYSSKKARHESRRRRKWRPSANSSMMRQALQVDMPQMLCMYMYMKTCTTHPRLDDTQLIRTLSSMYNCAHVSNSDFRGTYRARISHLSTRKCIHRCSFFKTWIGFHGAPHLICSMNMREIWLVFHEDSIEQPKTRLVEFLNSTFMQMQVLRLMRVHISWY